MKTLFYSFLFCFTYYVAASAATLTVPGTYTTIQDAINAASAGDTVLVDPGTYTENVDFVGKAITVKSSGGASVTTIDAGGSGIVVYFGNGEGNDSVLDGFTVKGGVSGNGSGIQCNGTSPTIKNNTITGNTGAAGLGISCLNGGPIITGNTIHGQDAMVLGGGIYCNNATAVIDNNTLYNNTAGGAGGAIYVTGGSVTIKNNLIHDNYSAIHGGGVQFASCAGLLVNNMIYDNEADANGGGLFCDGATTTVMCNTFFGNLATNGGGIGVGNTSAPLVINSIVWQNTATYDAEIWVDYSTSSITVEYCDVRYGFTGTGNMKLDPLFADANNKNFHLTAGSPCVNRGNNTGAPVTDFEGEARPCQGTVDMGADEYAGLHAFEADLFALSESVGGIVNYTLDAGVANANRSYVILGSATGTLPGLPLPGGLVFLPLNWDAFTNLTLIASNSPALANFNGVLDGMGQGSATLNTYGPIPTGTAGLVVHFAYMLYYPTIYYPYDYVSNHLALEVTP